MGQLFQSWIFGGGFLTMKQMYLYTFDAALTRYQFKTMCDSLYNGLDTD